MLFIHAKILIECSLCFIQSTDKGEAHNRGENAIPELLRCRLVNKWNQCLANKNKV